MSKKVVVLSTSLRSNSNSELLAKSLVEGAKFSVKQCFSNGAGKATEWVEIGEGTDEKLVTTEKEKYTKPINMYLL